MSFLLAQEIRIETIGFWTIIPFIIVLTIGLALVVAWVLRGPEET